MGKGIILITAAVLLGGGALILGIQQSAFESDRRLTAHQKQLLAREVARSGMNYASSEIYRDFSWRAGYQDVSHMGGRFNVTVHSPSAGIVHLSSEGTFAAQTYRIDRVLQRHPPFQGALTVDSRNITRADFGGSASGVSGLDRRLDGSPGPEKAIHAVFCNDPHVHQEITAAVNKNDHVFGVAGNHDIAAGHLLIDTQELVAEALLKADRIVQGDQKWGPRQQFGSPGNPEIVVVNGSVTGSHLFSGHGLLVVTGEVTEGNFTWNGPVLLFKDDSQKFELRGNGTVNGAVIISNRRSDRTISGYMDVDVYAGANQSIPIRHYHHFNDGYDAVSLDVLDDPKLHFRNVIGSASRQLRVQFFHAQASGGTHELRAGDVSASGLNSAGLDVTFDAAELETFVLDFETLEALKSSTPEDVRKSPSRDGVFHLKVSDAAAGDVLYELAVYDHPPDSPGPSKVKSAGKGGKQERIEGLEFKLSGSSKIFYSSEALWPLVDRLESLEKHVFIEMIDQSEYFVE